MEFIMDNYIWFVVAGIIIIMTLIGFIADKTNYIEKQKNKDKQKKEELTKKKEALVADQEEVNEVPVEDTTVEENLEDPLLAPEEEIHIEEEPAMELPQEESKRDKKKKKHKKDKKNKNEDMFENLDELTLGGENMTPVDSSLSELDVPPTFESPNYTIGNENQGLEGVDPSLTAPLEDGVLRLDAYDHDDKSQNDLSDTSIQMENNNTIVEEPIPSIETDKKEENHTTSSIQDIVPDFPTVEEEDLKTELSKEITPEIENANENISDPSLAPKEAEETERDVWKF
ncbi:MAG: hypothetical protein PHN72_06330 [Bacilli bacterium]|nr:hypothetical protein [Bacilli bacterium]